MPLIRRPDAPARASEPVSSPTGADSLLDGTVEERWTAARALAETPEGAQRLAAALEREREPHVLEAILTGLARNGGPDAVDALVRALGSDEAVLRTGAMDALRTAPAALAPRLPRLLAAADPDVRLLACDLARALPPGEAGPLLCARLAVEPQVNVCAAAVETLAEIGDETALPALARCAERFAHETFLSFAVTETARRLSARSAAPRG